MNKVILIGNLGADPELKETSAGSVLKLRVATSEKFLDKSGAKKERTEWHSVTLWGKRADALARFLTKGTKLAVEGSIRTSTYDKDGEKRYRTEISATDIELLGGGEKKGAPRDDGDFGAPSGGGGFDDIPF